MLRIRKKLTSGFLLTLLISGCGGGGGTANLGSVYQNYNFTEGQKSSEGAAAEALVQDQSRFFLPYIAPSGNYYSSLGQAHVSLNGSGTDLIGTVDTNARQAWKNGWTGKGVKIGVADSFNNNGVIDAHGDWVAVVAASVAPEAQFEYREVLGSYSLLGLVGDVNTAYEYFEKNGYHIINNSWGIERPKRNWDGSYSGSQWSDFNELVRATADAFDPNSQAQPRSVHNGSRKRWATLLLSKA